MANLNEDAIGVTGSLEEARRRVAAGGKVVLVVSPAQTSAAGALMAAAPGRLAVMVGEPGDPASWRAANEMAAELDAPVHERPTGPAGR